MGQRPTLKPLFETKEEVSGDRRGEWGQVRSLRQAYITAMLESTRLGATSVAVDLSLSDDIDE